MRTDEMHIYKFDTIDTITINAYMYIVSTV